MKGKRRPKFEIRTYPALAAGYTSETLILNPCREYRRQLRVTRTPGKRDTSLSIAVYGPEVRYANRISFTCTHEGLSDFSMENFGESSISIRGASFEVTREEYNIIASWLFPGPPLPQCWATHRGISRPTVESAQSAPKGVTVPVTALEFST